MITTYQKNQILNSIFSNSDSVLYIGLSTSAPSEDGSGVTEPSAPSYKRFKAEKEMWDIALNGTLSNNVSFRFSEAEESWTTPDSPVTHWVIFDAQENGNMLFFGELVYSQEIPRGAILEVPKNGLVTTILNV